MISIIIPVYNGEKYTKEALDSIYSQENADFEVIVVDDGSTDDTAEILDQFSDAKVIHQRNCGTSFARNRGLEEAQGEFVLFFDADDVLCPGALAKMENAMSGNEMVAGNYDKVDVSGKVLCKKASLVVPSTLYEFSYAPPVLGAKLFSRDIIEKHNIRFHPRLRVAEDLNFYLKYLSVITKAEFLDESLFQYRLTPYGEGQRINQDTLELPLAIATALRFARNHNAREDFFEAKDAFVLVHAREFFMKYRQTKNWQLKKEIFREYGELALQQNPEPMNAYLTFCKKDVKKQMQLKWLYLFFARR